MGIFHAVILGIVEGVTEFLPISSTGHLILASNLLRIPTTEFLKSFEITIQLGAILAVVVLYWKDLFVRWDVMKRIAVAFVPTALVGLILYPVIKKVLLGSTGVVIWSLLLGGIALILFERFQKKYPPDERSVVGDIEKISYSQALFIGACQSVAVIPGVSRAAATIVGGLLINLKRKTIVEFSFLLAVPTMLAATALDLSKSASSFASADFGVLVIGFVVSFVVALFVVRWFIRFVQSHTFTAFGWYRIAVAALFLLFVL